MSKAKRADGLSTGQWLEKRKAEGRCLACGARLSYRFDADDATGFLHDFCTVCRPMKQPPPRPNKKMSREERRRKGVEHLDKILGKL
jgi:hypothetical protein